MKILAILILHTLILCDGDNIVILPNRISEYIAILRKAAEYCNYSVSLSEMLRGRLICDISPETTVSRERTGFGESHLLSSIRRNCIKNLQTSATLKPTTNSDADLFKFNPAIPKKIADKTANVIVVVENT